MQPTTTFDHPRCLSGLGERSINVRSGRNPPQRDAVEVSGDSIDAVPLKARTGTTKSSSQTLQLKDEHLNPNYIPEQVLTLVESNRRNSPFIRLPGEIRNMIWAYLLSNLEVHLTLAETPSGEGIAFSPYQARGVPGSSSHSVWAFTTLPKVCRQTYAETSLLLYQSALFSYWGRINISTRRVGLNMPSRLQLSHIEGVQPSLVEKCGVDLKEKYFPGLKKIVAVLSRKRSHRRHALDEQGRVLEEEWIRKVQGSEVEIEFVETS